MARLSKDQIQAEVKAKGFGIIDASHYDNMQSIITIQCAKGHVVETNLDTIRKPSFICPTCESADFKMEKPTKVPVKNGYRVIAFDQATEKLGVSIYDAGKLVYYDFFHFTGDLIGRICKIRSLLEDIVIPQ